MRHDSTAIEGDTAAATPRPQLPASSVGLGTQTEPQWATAQTVSAARPESADRSDEMTGEGTADSSGSIAEWVAAVAHEMRTVQTSIGGFAELMAGDELDDAEKPAVATLISDQASEMTALIDDLMTVALVKARRLPVRLVRVSPIIIAEELESVSRAFRGAAISLDVKGQTHDVVVELSRLKQIVRGLLTNALKYGGPRIGVRFRADADRAAISVIDDGRGVPHQDRERIFLPMSAPTRALVSDWVSPSPGSLRPRWEDGSITRMLNLGPPSFSSSESPLKGRRNVGTFRPRWSTAYKRSSSTWTARVPSRRSTACPWATHWQRSPTRRSHPS